MLAVDGTCIKAVNNKDRKFTRSGSTRGDVEDGATVCGARTKNLSREDRGPQREARPRTGEDQISLTGPDSRAIAARTKVGVWWRSMRRTN